MQITFKTQNKEKNEIRIHKPFARNNQIIKVTEVELKDRIVKIIDTFDAIPISKPIEQSTPRAPRVGHTQENLTKRTILNHSSSSHHPRDPSQTLKISSSKNSVKNIMKLFEKWLHN
jgi:hypothetical protein